MLLVRVARLRHPDSVSVAACIARCTAFALPFPRRGTAASATGCPAAGGCRSTAYALPGFPESESALGSRCGPGSGNVRGMATWHSFSVGASARYVEQGAAEMKHAEWAQGGRFLL